LTISPSFFESDQVFVHGNATDEEAKRLADAVVDQLKFLPLSPAQVS
jgi:hypothetical protein